MIIDFAKITKIPVFSDLTYHHCLNEYFFTISRRLNSIHNALTKTLTDHEKHRHIHQG